MCNAQFVDFKRARRGGNSRPVGCRGRRNLKCSSARVQVASQRLCLTVIGARKNNISKNEASKEGSLKQ